MLIILHSGNCRVEALLVGDRGTCMRNAEKKVFFSKLASFQGAFL